jgi:DNA polymerase-3 subunit gamma/tau
MSYQVIARKWRPQTFEEVTGQEIVTRTLRNALEYDRLHHAYLFSGARGVGKTTTARLLAKALNCHKTTKPNLQPCSINDPDPCSSCVEISESRSMDVLEIDAASYTGIDAIRDTILEGININPARDRYKVFIIDEVHQLSKPAFNALLKTLEEPPPNVVFIMATTELHKVPETILSRCQEFQFRTIPLQKIFDRLKLIADAEKIAIDDVALREIARSGEGSMRDAQSNFDQVISFSGEKIAVADVAGALGLVGMAVLKRVIEAIAANDSKVVLEVVDEIVGQGQDTRNFCRDLLGLFRDLLVLKVAGGAENLLENAVLSADEMKRLAEPFSPSDLVRFFNSVGETEGKLREAAQTRFVLEIGLVKLVEMRRLTEIETLIERLNKLESVLSGIEIPAETARSAAAPEKKTLVSKKKDEPATELVVSELDVLPEPPIEPEPPQTKPDLSFLDMVPVRLPPISSEDLEHVDDEWLDAAYERKLLWSGDSPGPIKNIEQLAAALGGSSPNVKTLPSGDPANGSASAAAVRAFERPDLIPVFDDGTSEIPELSDNATEEELLAYAQNHPLVRQALRVFRGKIVEVTRRTK